MNRLHQLLELLEVTFYMQREVQVYVMFAVYFGRNTFSIQSNKQIHATLLP